MRLLFLSADAKHPDGLGNDTGQLGKHLMIKMFPHVDGYFPDIVFNRHTGPASQAVVLDDFVHDGFDAWGEGGFVGGSTLGAENQFLPIQIARETLPPDVPRWGSRYKEHLREWQHFGVVRYPTGSALLRDQLRRHRPAPPRQERTRSAGRSASPTTARERAAAGRLLRAKGDEILRTMGATKTWRGSGLHRRRQQPRPGRHAA